MITKTLYVGPPKTGRPRSVCLAPETVDVLKKWKTEQLRTKIRHANIWQDTGFIFTKDDGAAMHPDSTTDYYFLSETSEFIVLYIVRTPKPHIHVQALAAIGIGPFLRSGRGFP